ncbi:hypothetical protein VTK73DRAFT_2631 [Phialemonium thermophilum]|uniref:Uncharacterized protein n=1 Tax=Phialemonium thermophilum TaxID=223376 RepID=A0ABR3VQZ7_9PEZI
MVTSLAAAVLAEEGVGDHVGDGHGPALVAQQVGVGGDEGLEAVQGLEDQVGGQGAGQRHTGDDGSRLARHDSGCAAAVAVVVVVGWLGRQWGQDLGTTVDMEAEQNGTA